MERDGLDVSNLDAFTNRLIRSSKAADKEQKKFLRQEGSKLSRKTRQQARIVGRVAVKRSAYERAAGTYHSKIKRGRVYAKDGANRVRVYSGDPVGHLIEQGHEVVAPGGKRTGKRAKAFGVFEKAAEAFAPAFDKDCEEAVDRMIDKI